MSDTSVYAPSDAPDDAFVAWIEWLQNIEPQEGASYSFAEWLARSKRGGDILEPPEDLTSEREQEIRDNQTYVVMMALERVLCRRTDPSLTKVILDDLLDEVNRGE